MRQAAGCWIEGPAACPVQAFFRLQKSEQSKNEQDDRMTQRQLASSAAAAGEAAACSQPRMRCVSVSNSRQQECKKGSSRQQVAASSSSAAAASTACWSSQHCWLIAAAMPGWHGSLARMVEWLEWQLAASSSRHCGTGASGVEPRHGRLHVSAFARPAPAAYMTTAVRPGCLDSEWA